MVKIVDVTLYNYDPQAAFRFPDFQVTVKVEDHGGTTCEISTNLILNALDEAKQRILSKSHYKGQ